MELNTQDVNEMKDALAALRKSVDQKYDAIAQDVAKKANERMDALEKKNQEMTLKLEEEKTARLNAEEKFRTLEADIKMLPAGPSLQEKSVTLKAFEKFLSVGEKGLTPEEMKAMSAGSAADGGVLCPKEYKAELDKDITEISPLRSLARVITTSKLQFQMPRRTSRLSAVPTPEAAEVSESNSKYALQDFNCHKISALTKATVEVLNGSELNVESLINEDIAEEFAYKEGYFFVKGTGDAGKQPQGFTTDSSVPAFALPADFTGDDLIKMDGELKTGYDAAWTLNRKTLAYIRTLKDGAGHYVFTPFLTDKAPSSILGRPYVLLADMDATREAGKVPLSLGDYRRGYLIADFINMILVRDPYSDAGKGMIRFIAHRFLCGNVRRAEAIINGKITASAA